MALTIQAYKVTTVIRNLQTMWKPNLQEKNSLQKINVIDRVEPQSVH